MCSQHFPGNIQDAVPSAKEDDSSSGMISVIYFLFKLNTIGSFLFVCLVYMLT